MARSSKYSSIKDEIIEKKEVYGWQWGQIAAWVNEEYPGLGVDGGDINSEALRTAYRTKWTQKEDARDRIGEIHAKEDIEQGSYFITGVSPLSRYYSDTSNIDNKIWKSVTKAIGSHFDHLRIMPSRAHERALRSQPTDYDAKVRDSDLFVTNLSINSNLQVVDMYLNPQQVDPMTGTHHLTGQQYGYMFSKESPEFDDMVDKTRKSIIINHPKQMLQTHPVGKSKHPRLIMSTGFLSNPQYRKTAPGIKAENWHVLGGLSVDVVGKYFYARQIQINPKNGVFYDLGTKFHPTKAPEFKRADVLAVADPHIGWHSESGTRALIDMIEHFQPKRITVEDVFDGGSLQIFDHRSNFSKLHKPKCFSSLQAESGAVIEWMDRIMRHAPSDCKLIIKPSNHHKFLNYYLDSIFKGRQPRDCDVETAMFLGIAFTRGFNPLQVLIDHGRNSIAEVLVDNMIKSKYVWLEDNEDLFIYGIQNGAHTDEGVNKKKGNIQDAYKAYAYVTGGHGHMPSIYNGVYRNGTMKVPGQSYDKGQPKVWMQSHTVQHESHRQMITIIDDKFNGRY